VIFKFVPFSVKHYVSVFCCISISRMTFQWVRLAVGIDIDFQMFNKTSTRLPEALLYVFRPQHSRSWQMSKLGRLVDPLNVLLNGSQYQHGMYQSCKSISPALTLSQCDLTSLLFLQKLDL